MRVLNFGSLNLDYVYSVPRFVRPGETLAAESGSVMPGGKGLNQSVALARAGCRVFHAGCVGEGGGSLKKMLEDSGADTSLLRQVSQAQGHTVIQVAPDGENCILLFGGSNLCVTQEQVIAVMAGFGPGDWLLAQNEVNLLPFIVEEGYRRGMTVVLNPSPFGPAVRETDLNKVSWLLINEVEAEGMTGTADPDKAWARLHAEYPRLSVLITLGEKGSVCFTGGEMDKRVWQDAVRVRAADTTGAGDTYTGYFIAALSEGVPLEKCMALASRAAAVSVTRPGAAASIPRREELPL
ncbi:MAG: ribokinase [Clostridia bacterium]|nr:ribokinase [Clostridia bacterium]